jgi:hypothetical protein
MSPRNRHPDKDVQKALDAAGDAGAELEVRPKQGHAWGRLSCGGRGQDRCAMLIWSTPRNPYAHARDIRALMRKCPHTAQDTDTGVRAYQPPAHASTDE